MGPKLDSTGPGNPNPMPAMSPLAMAPGQPMPMMPHFAVAFNGTGGTNGGTDGGAGGSPSGGAGGSPSGSTGGTYGIKEVQRIKPKRESFKGGKHDSIF